MGEYLPTKKEIYNVIHEPNIYSVGSFCNAFLMQDKNWAWKICEWVSLTLFRYRLIYILTISYFEYQVKYAQNPSEFADIAEYVLVRFFGFTAGALVFYRQNREPIIYVRIWKCANVGITNNLMHVISDPQTPLEEVLLHEAKTVGILNIEYLLGPYS